MPENKGRNYPYTPAGKRQAEIDKNYDKAAKYGSGDFSVEPDKLNYSRYGCGRPHDNSVAYDGNLTDAGKAKFHPYVNPDPTSSSRPIPNGMYPGGGMGGGTTRSKRLSRGGGGGITGNSTYK